MGRLYLELIAKKGGFRSIIETTKCVVSSSLSPGAAFLLAPAKLIIFFCRAEFPARATRRDTIRDQPDRGELFCIYQTLKLSNCCDCHLLILLWVRQLRRSRSG